MGFMKRGPYRVFVWWLLFLLLGPVVGVAAMWGVWATNDVSEMGLVPLLVLGLAVSAFFFGGIVAFIMALVFRYRFSKKILGQDESLMVLCDDSEVLKRKGLDHFVGRLVEGNLPGRIEGGIDRYLTLRGSPKRVSSDSIPFISLWLQSGPAQYKWGGVRRMVAGVAKGSVCRVSIQDNWGATGRLAHHEICHVVISFGLGLWDSDHHGMMRDSGIERAKYLSEIFI